MFALALANAPANAQAGATPAAPDKDASTASEPRGGSTEGPTANDLCHALEHSAAENGLPVEFFARVIWQESRFDAQTLSQEVSGRNRPIHADDRQLARSRRPVRSHLVVAALGCPCLAKRATMWLL